MTDTRSPAEHPGLAVLHGYDPETGQTSVDLFPELPDDEGTSSPYFRALEGRARASNAHPDWIFSVGQNRRSSDLVKAVRRSRMDEADETAAARPTCGACGSLLSEEGGCWECARRAGNAS